MTTPTYGDVLQIDVTDEELEAAAEQSALSYTYQTSDYDKCCS